MPLLLEFKPTTKIQMPNPIVHEFLQSVDRTPYIPHQGIEANIKRDQGNFIEQINLRINGLSVIDEESENMLCSIIRERIKELNLPFRISGSSRHRAALPGEALFLHERFKPIRSKNSKLLAKIAGLEIPEEFCCLLSGDIMDEPVYDIRSPGVHYDQDFLEYCLRKSNKKLMPHTNVPCNASFIKTNFDLKIRIINFVKFSLQTAEIQNRGKILEKFKVGETSDKKSLNQALRRAAMTGYGEDMGILLSLGANVNAQDDNPQKRYTALHLAIRENKIQNAVYLVSSGARIDIPDALGITATQLIVERHVLRDPEIQPLIYNCEIFGLSLPGVIRTPNQPPIAMQMARAPNNAALFGGVGSSSRPQQSNSQAPSFPGGRPL